MGVVPSPFILKGLVVMLGAGDGSFGEPVFFSTGGGPADLDLGDVDEDGHLDVVVAPVGSNRVQVLLGDPAAVNNWSATNALKLTLP